jgi:hypothetical protein
MGQFSGKLELGLERVDGRWEQVADGALVGDTGYQINGSWYMGQEDILDIRSGASAGDDAAIWHLPGDPIGWPI